MRDIGQRNEKIFISLLTEEANCGMIAAVCTVTAYSGDADAAAEAPPRLTSSPNLARSYVVRW